MTNKIWDGNILKPGGSNTQLRLITRITQVASVRLQSGRREEIIGTFRIGEPFGKSKTMSLPPITKGLKPTCLQSIHVHIVALQRCSAVTSVTKHVEFPSPTSVDLFDFYDLVFSQYIMQFACYTFI